MRKTIKQQFVVIAMCIAMFVLVGCQTDLQGGVTMKWIRKGENNNQEFLSRGSGMAGASTYAAGGGNAVLTQKGQGGSIWSWGNSK